MIISHISSLLRLQSQHYKGRAIDAGLYQTSVTGRAIDGGLCRASVTGKTEEGRFRTACALLGQDTVTLAKVTVLQSEDQGYIQLEHDTTQGTVIILCSRHGNCFIDHHDSLLLLLS